MYPEKKGGSHKMARPQQNWGLLTLLTRWASIWTMPSLWPSDTIWRHKSGSTLAHVMACCLTAPSHYPNQCWLFTRKVQWHSSECNFTRDTSAISHWNYLRLPMCFCSVQFLCCLSLTIAVSTVPSPATNSQGNQLYAVVRLYLTW